MIHFTLACVGLGVAILLLPGGLPAIGWRSPPTSLTANQRLRFPGGSRALLALVVVTFWLRHWSVTPLSRY